MLDLRAFGARGLFTDCSGNQIGSSQYAAIHATRATEYEERLVGIGIESLLPTLMTSHYQLHDRADSAFDRCSIGEIHEPCWRPPTPMQMLAVVCAAKHDCQSAVRCKAVRAPCIDRDGRQFLTRRKHVAASCPEQPRHSNMPYLDRWTGRMRVGRCQSSGMECAAFERTRLCGFDQHFGNVVMVVIWMARWLWPAIVGTRRLACALRLTLRVTKIGPTDPRRDGRPRYSNGGKRARYSCKGKPCSDARRGEFTFGGQVHC